MVPPERIELSSPAPEAGTLSTELQGHSMIDDSTRPRTQQQPSVRAMAFYDFEVDKPVIPAKAGIQNLFANVVLKVTKTLDSCLRRNDGCAELKLTPFLDNSRGQG